MLNIKLSDHLFHYSEVLKPTCVSTFLLGSNTKRNTPQNNQRYRKMEISTTSAPTLSAELDCEQLLMDLAVSLFCQLLFPRSGVDFSLSTCVFKAATRHVVFGKRRMTPAFLPRYFGESRQKEADQTADWSHRFIEKHLLGFVLNIVYDFLL